MSEWKFLTNHALVLSFLAKNPSVTVLEIAQAIGIRERATSRIIADLEVAGYITRKREGRVNSYGVNPNLPMRHHTCRHVAVGHFLETLASDEPDPTQSLGRERVHSNR